jgi:hypothetical protein
MLAVEVIMHKWVAAFLLMLGSAVPACAKVVVFWQDGFPTVASQPITREALVKALDGADPVFTGLDGFRNPATLTGIELLVLPYGSAVPADAWGAIHSYLRAGGNLLVIGGQPLRVPVTLRNGHFLQALPQDTYSRELGLRHSYELPPQDGTKFAWRHGYTFLSTPAVRARKFFVMEGRLEGLGYMVNTDGIEVAAPVIVEDHTNETRGNGIAGSRAVMLDFDPQDGYWESPDGISLIHEAAQYAQRSATALWLEMLFSTLKPSETPQVGVHLRAPRRELQAQGPAGAVKLELVSGTTVLETTQVPCPGVPFDAEIVFHKLLQPGFYTLRAVYEEAGQPHEFYQNGFWVEDEKLLASGPELGVNGDFLTRDGKSFFPFGSNYFSTEANGWDFSGPRNAWIWERDFADMQRHGVTFVRTGVWMPFLRFLEPFSGAPSERFLRNLEAYLLCARRHNIIVNFTFFAFAPASGRGDFGDPTATGPNPYLDAGAIRAEQDYVLSVVNRFKGVPWLCWDLINEPSFSNPRRLWKGNTPNGDPAETSAWHKWLREKYGDIADLAAAWAVTPEQLGSFDAVPLPGQQDLAFERYGNARQVRAVDYNLFAQDMFTQWVRSMVTAIRGTGSKQLINVGQDEGGVTDRVLNQFYAAGGVSFTTNHTYWRDDALLWDSVVAKRPGMPNIVGETGYQPVWAPDGAWRYDEFTGFPLLERKWALGFAAASSGALQWDWDREVDFGMKRSDGSAKIWQAATRDMGQFAEKAAPYATGVIAPQVAIVLPQSLQLSILNTTALEAQQKCVRALYQYARAEAYVVGEYQIEQLGNPKLILLPSPFTLTESAWNALRSKVEAGAILLVSGPFDADAHFHPTRRQMRVGLPYEDVPLTIREQFLKWPGGEARLSYGADKTTFLNRALLPDGRSWAEMTVGQGKILFAADPLELNDNLQAIGDVYRYALKVAGVAATYTTNVQDPGILVTPTQYPHATLYVLTSETGQAEVSFRDQRSGKQFTTGLNPGRAALLLIGEDGGVLAAYNWRER